MTFARKNAKKNLYPEAGLVTNASAFAVSGLQGSNDRKDYGRIDKMQEGIMNAKAGAKTCRNKNLALQSGIQIFGSGNIAV